MNHREDLKIIHVALENLRNTANIMAEWKGITPKKQADGKIDITIQNRHYVFTVEIKTEIRNHQLPEIYRQAKQYENYLLVAERLYPNIKKELRKHNIAYLEANGDIFLNKNGNYIWIDTNKPTTTERKKENRAFTKTGLIVLFYFLQDELRVNLPYRFIVENTDAGLGNITNVMKGLKDAGFLIKINNIGYRLTNKKELLERWIVAYEERLKPKLEIGRFHFLKEEDFAHWKQLPLKTDKTLWGGEPGGALFTNYLNPGELTLYTLETRNELIKHYRLVPDEIGNVVAYKKFWKFNEVNDNVVPPLLIYADLMNKNDSRCRETAQIIYDDLIKQNL